MFCFNEIVHADVPKAKESARVNDTDRSRIDGLNELEVTEKILWSVISLNSTLEKTHEKSWTRMLFLISVFCIIPVCFWIQYTYPN